MNAHQVKRPHYASVPLIVRGHQYDIDWPEHCCVYCLKQHDGVIRQSINRSINHQNVTQKYAADLDIHYCVDHLEKARRISSIRIRLLYLSVIAFIVIWLGLEMRGVVTIANSATRSTIGDYLLLILFGAVAGFITNLILWFLYRTIKGMFDSEYQDVPLFGGLLGVKIWIGTKSSVGSSTKRLNFWFANADYAQMFRNANAGK